MIILILLVACSQTKIVSTIKDQTIKDDVIGYLEEITIQTQGLETFTIVSRVVNGNKNEIVTEFYFTTDSAKINAKMNLEYTKSNDIWTLQKKDFIIISIEVTQNADVEMAKMIVKNNPMPMFDSFNLYLFDESKLTFVSNEKTSETTSIIKYEYTDHQLNWDFDEIFVVTATYDYTSGWNYSLSDWSTQESSDWVGQWRIQWYTPEGTTIETIKDISISGELSITNNMAGSKIINNTLMVNFTIDGKEYSELGIIYGHDQSTREVQVKTGPGTSDWFAFGLSITAPSISTQEAGYYATSQKYVEGMFDLIK